MHRNCLKIASLVIISGCATWSRSDVKSDWGALQDAARLDCRDLPLLTEDLKIDRVHVLPSSGPSLLLEVSSRKGVRNFYHLAFRKMGDLSPSNLKKLPIGEDSSFLGGGIAGSKTVFVVRPLIKGKAFIQVRDLTNNAVIAQFPSKLAGEFELGAWHLADDKLYAYVREEKSDEALDDQPYLELAIPLDGAKKNLSVQTNLSRVIGSQVETLEDGQKRRWAFTLDKGLSSSKKEPRFRITPWMAGKNDVSIELSEKGPIESWNLSDGDKGLLLAFIKGDSLLWENTSLEVTTLAGAEPFQKQAQATYALSRVHVGQPLVAASSKEAMVFLPQWLDHEISIASYKVNGSELESKGYLGVFKEGSSFEQAFYHQPSEKYYLLSRFSGGSTQRYSLCEVDR